MTIHEIFTVGSTATQITPSGTHSGMDITIQNINAAADVYVGGEAVTSTDYGFKIVPGAAISFELAGYDDLFLASDQEGQQAAVIKVSLED